MATVAHGSQAPPGGETIHTKANHLWLTADRGWVLAGELVVGERVVRLDGTTATITALAVRPGVADYYNLTVSELHTFAVGSGRFVVHNECGPQVLRHYTSQAGHDGILDSESINSSTKALNPADARHGDGVYLTDLILEQGWTKGQISYKLWNQPWSGHKLDYFVDIDVTGLGARNVAPGIFLIPTEDASISIAGRIMGHGPMLW